jgi:hypothetical protein
MQNTYFNNVRSKHSWLAVKHEPPEPTQNYAMQEYQNGYREWFSHPVWLYILAFRIKYRYRR